MIVRKNQEVPVRVREDHVEMTDFFGADCPTDGRVSMGYAVFPPGTVVPLPPTQGTSTPISYPGKSSVRAAARSGSWDRGTRPTSPPGSCTRA